MSQEVRYSAGVPTLEDFAGASPPVVVDSQTGILYVVKNGDTVVAVVGTGGGGLSDGDYGDIVVSSGGTVIGIDSAVMTAAGRALVDDASAADQRTTLGLGTAAVAATGDFEVAGAVSTHAALTETHGISAFGASLVDDLTAAAARATLGIGDSVGGGQTVFIDQSEYVDGEVGPPGATGPAGPAGAAAPQVDEYTTGSTVWNKPAGAVLVRIECVGSGGGGGGGSATGTNRSGGGGGGGGAYTKVEGLASLFPSSMTAVVGAAGTGGDGNSGSGGNIAVNGSASYVYNGSVYYCNAEGGKAGLGGSTAALAINNYTDGGIAGAGPYVWDGLGSQTSAGGATSTTGTAAAPPNTSASGGGGGGGGSIATTTGRTSGTGAIGSFFTTGGAGKAPTSASGATATGTTGGAGTGASVTGFGGSGGGGGGAAIVTSGAFTATGGIGGAGGYPGGGGGGGGAAYSAAGTAIGGKGGIGADGYIRITTFF